MMNMDNMHIYFEDETEEMEYLAEKLKENLKEVTENFEFEIGSWNFEVFNGKLFFNTGRERERIEKNFEKIFEEEELHFIIEKLLEKRMEGLEKEKKKLEFEQLKFKSIFGISKKLEEELERKEILEKNKEEEYKKMEKEVLEAVIEWEDINHEWFEINRIAKFDENNEGEIAFDNKIKIEWLEEKIKEELKKEYIPQKLRKEIKKEMEKEDMLKDYTLEKILVNLKVLGVEVRKEAEKKQDLENKKENKKPAKKQENKKPAKKQKTFNFSM